MSEQEQHDEAIMFVKNLNDHRVSSSTLCTGEQDLGWLGIEPANTRPEWVFTQARCTRQGGTELLTGDFLHVGEDCLDVLRRVGCLSFHTHGRETVFDGKRHDIALACEYQVVYS